jgi:putative acetyltransferase
MPLIVRPASLTSPEAQDLIRALDDYLNGLYPPEGNFLELDPTSVDGRDGVFLIAWEAGVAVGCGAVRRISPDEAEIKRMFVLPASRGRGVARRILSELERWTRGAGFNSVVLETGPRQPEAIQLYESVGFHQIPCFGPYAASAYSVCYRKSLGDASPR